MMFAIYLVCKYKIHTKPNYLKIFYFYSVVLFQDGRHHKISNCYISSNFLRRREIHNTLKSLYQDLTIKHKNKFKFLIFFVYFF